MLLTANGGDGDDILIRHGNDNVLSGGAEDDVLNGNGGSTSSTADHSNNAHLNAATTAQLAASLWGQAMASSFVPPDVGGAKRRLQSPRQQPPLLAQPHA
jgi:hypothetical protein